MGAAPLSQDGPSNQRPRRSKLVRLQVMMPERACHHHHDVASSGGSSLTLTADFCTSDVKPRYRTHYLLSAPSYRESVSDSRPLLLFTIRHRVNERQSNIILRRRATRPNTHRYR
jgi:hypothetical protein